MDQHPDQHRITILITIQFTDHIICVCQQSLPDWESCVFVISVPVPWVCLLCQHARWARSVPACQQMSPDVLKALTLSHCARWQFKFHKDCTYGSDLFVMMIFDCFTLSCDGQRTVFVTIYCLSLFIVYFIVLLDWIIMEDTVYSLCLVFSNCTFINHIVPDKWKSFCKSKSYLFSISIHFMTSFT